MKTIGLLGGMSWESTLTYYRVINETVKERLGGLHLAKSLLYSTELGMLVRSGDVAIPVFDTALIHAEEAALAALL